MGPGLGPGHSARGARRPAPGTDGRRPRPPSGAPEITVFSVKWHCDDHSCCHLLRDQSDGWIVLQKLAASIQWVKKTPPGEAGSPDVMCSASRDIPLLERSL